MRDMIGEMYAPPSGSTEDANTYADFSAPTYGNNVDRSSAPTYGNTADVLAPSYGNVAESDNALYGTVSSVYGNRQGDGGTGGGLIGMVDDEGDDEVYSVLAKRTHNAKSPEVSRRARAPDTNEVARARVSLGLKREGENEGRNGEAQRRERYETMFEGEPEAAQDEMYADYDEEKEDFSVLMSSAQVRASSKETKQKRLGCFFCFVFPCVV